ncbi:hypothetical protein SAZ11_55240 [Streptomyces sp. FXJ1.4098]|nr:hypothetical protein [Streptomyces sp. FXJ1.4098]
MHGQPELPQLLPGRRQVHLDQPGEWYYDKDAKRLYLVRPRRPRGPHRDREVRELGRGPGRQLVCHRPGLDLWGTSLRTGDTSTGVLVEALRARYISEFSTLPMPRDDELAIPPFEGHIVAAGCWARGCRSAAAGTPCATAISGTPRAPACCCAAAGTP